ncbi:MAG TPA: L,D-transpeptidase family protein [Gaiellaceae bacterium]|nr:L,D-transpeptidase family protein [Gaiellaceae bacterium]
MRGLQRRLAQLGYRSGRADGAHGAETASACIVNVSTGSGETYDLPGGGSAVAYTPAGRFTVYRNVEGIVEAPLGSLYKPLYFDQGWAVHGAASVPGYPASHRCVRTSDQDQDFVSRTLAKRSAVIIHGKSLGEPGQGRPGF